MSITYLDETKIIFNELEGEINNEPDYIAFINKICKIDTSKYDKIYEFHPKNDKILFYL